MEENTENIKKRPRDDTKRQTRFAPGLRGFLFTVHQRNLSLARREIEALLGDYVKDEGTGGTVGTVVVPPSTSLLAALHSELQPTIGKRFVCTKGIYPIECDTKGNLFYALEPNVTTSAPDIARRVLTDLKVKPRNLFRMYPVVATCWSQPEFIREMCKDVIGRLAQDANEKKMETVKVNIQMHVKFHTTLAKMSCDLRCELLKIMWEASPRFVFEGTAPEVVMNVHVLKHVTCVGYSWDHTELFGYNLHTAGQAEGKEEEDEYGF